LKQVYATELADRSPKSTRALGAKILQQAAPDRNEPAADQFVLLIAAIQAGRDGSDMELCCHAADTLGREFQVDSQQVKCTSALESSLRLETPAQTANNCRIVMRLADEAATNGHVDLALKLLRHLGAVAPVAGVNDEVESSISELEARRSAAERVAPYLQRLKTSPSDQTANLEVGEFYCMVEDDWAKGLLFLTRAGKSALASAAELDLRSPKQPQEQVAVGDAWWEAAETSPGPVQSKMRERAALWYAKALESESISGLQRILLEKRIAQTSSSRPRPARVVIVSARFGAGDRVASVAKTIQATLDADPYVPLCATVEGLGAGDPAPFTTKQLKLDYEVGGVTHHMDVPEAKVLVFPPAPDDGVQVPGASMAFKVIAARYGVDNRWIDVTDQVRKEFTSPTARVKTHNMANGQDFHLGVPKFIAIYFELHGRRYARLVTDNEMVSLMKN